jgi:hypothetical protein
LQSTSRRAEDQVGFDPYHRWLGISPGQRPPTHYQLLGISPEEEDLEVIHAAALRQSAYVRNFQSGPHADLAARVLSELAEARAALTDPARRKEYDARLPRQDADRARARHPASAPRPKQEPPSAAEAVEPAASRRPASGAHSRLPAAVVAGLVLLTAIGGGVAALRMLGGDRHPSARSDPVGAGRPSAEPGPQPARRNAAELPFAVKPADATVTVVSGRATIAGEGASRRLVLPEQTAAAEVRQAEQTVADRRQEAQGDFGRWLASFKPSKDSEAPTDGLILHAALNEGEGRNVTVAVEGKSRPIALPAGAEWGIGHLSPKAFRPKPGATLEVPDVGDFETGQAFSYGAWVMPPEQADGAIFARMDNGNAARGWDLWMQGRKVGANVVNRWPEDALKVVSRKPLEPGKWSHVFFTYDGSAKVSGCRVYANGIPQELDVEADSLRSTIRTSVPFTVGQRHASQFVLQGVVVQDVRIYGRALSPAEVQRLGGTARIAALAGKPNRTETETKELFEYYLATGEEVTIRAEAKGYEPVTRTLSFGGQQPRAVQAIELTPLRKWLREIRNSYWYAANPSMALAEHSISMQPPQQAGNYASVIFDIIGYRTFHAKVSLRPDADQDSASPMTFAVFGDGKLLWASEKIQKRGESDDCVCEVTGVRRLELRVRCGVGDAFARGAWIDPYLVECDAFAEAARAERKKRGLPAYLESESYWRPEAQIEAPPVQIDSPPRAETNPPRAPKLIPVFKVVFPGDVLLTTSEQEVKGIQKHYPGEFKGDSGHWAGSLGYAFAEQQPGTVLLRRYLTGGKHVFTTRKLDNPRYKEEGLGAWVPERETPGASVRLGFFRKKDAAREYGPEGVNDAFRKIGYHPSGLRFYLFDQGRP